ncbi:ComEA family DNA-binding protein [Nocardioides sp.]|uniref:ComEA family DNA-binding protein n=1 Tax=Nocardioides sp. TaxID=35761 RepID=UPI002B27868E|nr:ComEA family DNA-binding protein [Nocardioides sp.]
MRSRRPSSEHSEAVTRRLAELSDQLAAARAPAAPEEGPIPEAVGGTWWDEHTRVAQRPVLSLVGPVEPVEPVAPVTPVAPDSAPPSPHEPSRADDPDHQVPPVIPVPGRHAAHRKVVRAAGVVPEPLRARIGLGTAQLTAVAVLVALGLAITCWWVVRGDPEPPVSMAAVPGGASIVAPTPGEALAAPLDPSDPLAAEQPGAADETVTVDVAGKVRRPGIVVLDAGARVVEALAEAGGARKGVDTTSLDLARVLVDGEQLLVGQPGSAPGAPLPPAAGGVAPPAALVDLNLADQTLLETLPQVGPVTAAAIIAWRTEHGAFMSVTELLEVDGIGEATLAQLTPLVTV